MTIIVINNKRLQCGKRTKGALGSQEGIIARGGTFMGPHPALDRHCAGLSPAPVSISYPPAQEEETLSGKS